MASSPTPHPGSSASVTTFQVRTDLDVDVVLRPEARVTVRGELDMASSPILTNSLAKIDPIAHPTVALDLSDLGFIDLAGLSAILEAKHRLAYENCELVVVGMSRAVVRLLQVLNRIGSSVDLTVAV